MPTLLNLVGRRFERLVVTAFAGHAGVKTLWQCVCDCGKTVIVRSACLRRKDTRSCGCLNIERLRRRNRNNVHNKKHGASGTPEYQSFASAKYRCNKLTGRDYNDYGGRGIEFRFKDFEEFFTELGLRPVGQSLDRVDNDGHYEPGNVRWATPKQQTANRRRGAIEH